MALISFTSTMSKLVRKTGRKNPQENKGWVRRVTVNLIVI